MVNASVVTHTQSTVVNVTPTYYRMLLMLNVALIRFFKCIFSFRLNTVCLP